MCNCLPSSRAVTPLGLLGRPCVLSGSLLVLAALVWLPCCVMSDLSLSLVSLGNICAPQIVFVARQLYMMYKFTSGSASLSRLENPKGLL